MKQVISVVGAGGKTTVVENLSQNLSKYFDVLVSTTTRMKLPQAYKYDRLIISKDEFEDNKSYFLKYNIVADKIEINFCSDFYQKNVILQSKVKYLNPQYLKMNIQNNFSKINIIEKNNLKNILLKNRKRIYYFLPKIDMTGKYKKFMHIDESQIKMFLEYYDYILLESDGAREKRLKLPNKNEPVVSKYTTTTIAVFDVTMIGQIISEQNTYNIEKFESIGKKSGDILELDDVIKMIELKSGIFNNAVGEKLLIINKIKSKIEIDNATYIKQKLKDTDIRVKFKQSII